MRRKGRLVQSCNWKSLFCTGGLNNYIIKGLFVISTWKRHSEDRSHGRILWNYTILCADPERIPTYRNDINEERYAQVKKACINERERKKTKNKKTQPCGIWLLKTLQRDWMYYLYTARLLWPAIRYPITQLLHLCPHRSNSTAPLKYLCCYHVVPTQLLCWSIPAWVHI